jgi:hypothetical protein
MRIDNSKTQPERDGYKIIISYFSNRTTLFPLKTSPKIWVSALSEKHRIIYSLAGLHLCGCYYLLGINQVCAGAGIRVADL